MFVAVGCERYEGASRYTNDTDVPPYQMRKVQVCTGWSKYEDGNGAERKCNCIMS